jgi:hypothetical protein
MCTSEKIISSVIIKLHLFKAAGSNDIHIAVLKCIGSPLVLFFKPFFQTCIVVYHYPTAFCHCNTVHMRKPDEKDFSVPEAW